MHNNGHLVTPEELGGVPAPEEPQEFKEPEENPQGLSLAEKFEGLPVRVRPRERRALRAQPKPRTPWFRSESSGSRRHFSKKKPVQAV